MREENHPKVARVTIFNGSRTSGTTASLGPISTGLADDRPHGRGWGLRPCEPRSDDAWSPGSETRLWWLPSGSSVLPSFNPACSYIGGRTSCVQRECFPDPASSTGGRFSPRQRLPHSTERFDPRSSASIRSAFLPDSRMLVGLALAAGEGRASGAVLGVGGAAGGGGAALGELLAIDGIGDESRDSDPSSISLIPFRRGSRSFFHFQADHVNNPMLWDRVGCHNGGIRRGHDHDDDSSSRNRQIVDDPA